MYSNGLDIAASCVQKSSRLIDENKASSYAPKRTITTGRRGGQIEMYQLQAYDQEIRNCKRIYVSTQARCGFESG
jgi:hypothetical protein